MNHEQIERAFNVAGGIVNHEFSQDVIESCKPLMESMKQRLIDANGSDEVFEQIDQELMNEWNKLHKKITD